MKKDFLSRHIVKMLAVLSLVAIAIAIAAFITYRLTFPGALAVNQNAWGAFGDFIGGVLNPLFALLAFFALLITIIIQNRELSLSTEELTKSAKALTDQSKAIELQNFESTFFQMVRLHNEIVSNMFFGEPDTADNGLHGRSCFEEYYKRFRDHYDRANSQAKVQDPLQIIEDGYAGFVKEKQSDIGHYFRNLYTIIKFVDRGPIKNKKQYTNIVRAQLSSYELALLFYNCLWHVGRIKFKDLVEEYELLENMNLELLTNPEDQLPLYKSKAYGELEDIRGGQPPTTDKVEMNEFLS